MRFVEGPQQYQFERHVLQCLSERSPLSLSQIKDWVRRHGELSKEDLASKRYKSGKEIRVFEQAVANLLTPGRKANLTDLGFVERYERDSYGITAEGHRKLGELIAEHANWKEIFEQSGIEFDDKL